MLRLGSQVVRRIPEPDLRPGLQGEKLTVASAEAEREWALGKTLLMVVATCACVWLAVAYLFSVLPDIFVSVLGYLLSAIT